DVRVVDPPGTLLLRSAVHIASPQRIGALEALPLAIRGDGSHDDGHLDVYGPRCALDVSRRPDVRLHACRSRKAARELLERLAARPAVVAPQPVCACEVTGGDRRVVLPD